MSFSTLVWEYPSSSSSSPLVPSASVSAPSTSVTSPSTSPHDSGYQLQPDVMPLEVTPKYSTPPDTVDPADITTTPIHTPSAKKKKQVVLPNYPVYMREEDDWTKVEDPKEKKKIQNRVAQRTYRHRMKARLGELQARLEGREQDKAQQPLPKSSDSSTSAAAVRGFTAINQMPGIESPLSPVSQNKSSPSQVLSLMQPAVYEEPTADGTEPIFPPIPRNDLNSPPQAQTHLEAGGLLSPPNQPMVDQISRLPHEFVLDCLRFQTHLLNRLNSLQQQLNFVPSYPSGSGVPSQALESIIQAEQVPCVSAFSPTHAEAMEYSLNTNVEVWKTGTMSKIESPSPPSHNDNNHNNNNNMLPFSAPTTPNAVLDCHEITGSGSSIISPMPQLAQETISLDERMEGIMEKVRAAGFDSFDALVSAYYCGNFGEASFLANEQRLSRNRRLPKVIDDVFQATKHWSAWERRGFQEEILKTAESMLKSEAASAHNPLMAKITPLLDLHEITNQVSTAEALVDLKRSIQDQLPNSWALGMALSFDSRNSWQRDRSNTALATTLLTNFSGRIPNDQLLQIIGACL
ncbi:hypothetical protein M441DRAFT_31164 [Trichoderma asperellum CBS 433.97]|uniref:BZIP domain-containing protein n=1 Tax=Trichoderma asperellum (strain ATCC 204424 / CBS 433.97 / NBRC 101777) TaxID=1042311 RepID=A0A2T3YVN7_TRIA4|nr:hypothetical protein M441DRAFT_31164 [Trichoderma asperellum CBS 433.97]PTB36580.1 hypothetical protein M441DRAFT_31164 [Trichoderma asperellum CBS 433.97]